MSGLNMLKRLIVVASVVGLIGCDEDGTEPQDEVSVILDEFTVTPSRSSVDDGTVRFMIDNQGTEVHEFVVVRTDLDADDLPMNANGSFDEDGAGVDVIDEVEAVQPNGKATLEVSLDEGHYVLLCNRVEVEDGEVESHYAMGMRAELEVH